MYFIPHFAKSDMEKVRADWSELLTRNPYLQGKTLATLSNLKHRLQGPFTDIDVKRPNDDIARFGHKVAKTKRGLPGFVNGTRTAALADTGAAQNIISLDFAHRHGLVLEGKTAMLRLGNSKSVQSAGQSKQILEVVAVTIYTC